MADKENPVVIKAVNPIKKQEVLTKKDLYFISLAVISLSFVLLMVVVSFLNISIVERIFSLLLGSFLIFDILHSIKWYYTRS